MRPDLVDVVNDVNKDVSLGMTVVKKCGLNRVITVHLFLLSISMKGAVKSQKYATDYVRYQKTQSQDFRNWVYPFE